MTKIIMMNKYIADLAVMNSKLHNLHWNVTGSQFMPIHLFTEELYNELFINYDDAAEQIKMLGEFPMARMKDYLASTSIEEFDAKDFTEMEVLQAVSDDLMSIQALAKNIRKLANEDDDFNTVALFEGHITAYAKRLWFIDAMLK